jgi:hypothetical protein
LGTGTGCKNPAIFRTAIKKLELGKWLFDCTLPWQANPKSRTRHAGIRPKRTKEGEGENMDELTIDAAICSDYERLLKESQRGLVAWRERSEEVIRFGLNGKSIGDELQKLQAAYATAYHRLEQHGKTCILCQFTIGLTENETPTSVFISPRRELPA